MKIGICSECGEFGVVELHHIISRKQQPALKDCKLNLINLCTSCHRGTYGVHGKYPEDIKEKLISEFQDKLCKLFEDEELYDLDEVEKKLKIKFSEALMLSKLMYPMGGLYFKEDIIRVCMGKRL